MPSSAAVSAKLRCGDTLPLGMPQFLVRFLLISNTRVAPPASRRKARTPDSMMQERPFSTGAVSSVRMSSATSGMESVPVLEAPFQSFAASDRFGRFLISPRWASCSSPGLMMSAILCPHLASVPCRKGKRSLRYNCHIIRASRCMPGTEPRGSGNRGPRRGSRHGRHASGLFQVKVSRHANKPGRTPP
jgi:hypothetical protein